MERYLRLYPTMRLLRRLGQIMCVCACVCLKSLWYNVIVIKRLECDGEHALWFQLFSVPLLLAGIALVHHSVNALQLHLGYLGLMYLGLTMFSPVFALLLVFLAVIDSHIDLRVKLATLIDSRPPV